MLSRVIQHFFALISPPHTRACLFWAAIIMCAASNSEAQERKTLGYVLSGFDYQFYGNENAKEACPFGLTPTSMENWRALFPTDEQRQAEFDRCGAVDNRGPNCESVLMAPELSIDPLPYREVTGKKSYGINLDGTKDGRATALTCAHEKFVSPDGKTPGVDNQYYRLLGCQSAAHGAALKSAETKRRLIDVPHLRTLMEIRDVDSEVNDDDVTVYIHEGRDSLLIDPEDNAIPFQSQRISEASRIQSLHGRIINGELIAGPADIAWRDVAFSFNTMFYVTPVFVHRTQLRLRLSETQAVGLRTGYVDAEDLWRVFRTGYFYGSSPPSLFASLKRLSDGHKDAKTGVCGGLSSATKLEFTRANIIRVGVEGVVR